MAYAVYASGNWLIKARYPALKKPAGKNLEKGGYLHGYDRSYRRYVDKNKKC